MCIMSDLATQVLDATLEDLLRRRDEAIAAVKDARLRLRRLQIELSALQRVREQITAAYRPRRRAVPEEPMPRPSRLPKASAENGSPTPGRLPPSEAVLRFVRDHPGLPPAEIVAGVKSLVETSSANPEKVLYSTVRQLERRGRLVRAGLGGKGGVFLSKEEGDTSESAPGESGSEGSAG
jgi:hypothetical protein